MAPLGATSPDYRAVPRLPGNCFLTAASVAADLVREGFVRVLICHGRPIGGGAENAGLRYWHAWVEAKLSTGWEVFDASNGRVRRYRRAVYYRAGSIAQGGERVHRFTPRQAAAMLERYHHAGPWVPSYRDGDL